MAIVAYVKVKKQSAGAMYGVIKYCTRDDKVRDTETGMRIVSGINCNGENSFREFMTTKAAYEKMEGTYYYHYVQSFSHKEGITYQEAHNIAREFASEAWPGHEILVSTHLDTKNPHSHFVINSVNFENGYKLRQDTHTLKHLRELSDRICMSHGYSIIKNPKKHTSYMSRGEYRATMKRSSWKFELKQNINRVMKKCGSRKDFVQEMKRRGYDMIWTNERKYITFICPDGNRCRDIKLHEPKYLKERIEDEFKLREEISKEPPIDKTVSQKSVKDDRWIIFGDEPKPETKRENIIEHTTGWEKERGIYYGDIQDDEYETSEVLENEEREDIGAEESYAENHHYGGNDFGGIVGTALHGAAALADIIQSNSGDEEERKKEQEAKTAGGNLGAAIGIGAAIVSALVSKDKQSDELSEQNDEIVREKNEIDEISEEDIEDDEYIDFMMGM